MAANDDIIKAKEKWYAAKEAGDQAGMDAAHAAAESARASGGTIGANTVTQVDIDNHSSSSNNTWEKEQYSSDRLGKELTSGKGKTAGINNAIPEVPEGMLGTDMTGYMDSYFDNMSASMLSELKMSQKTAMNGYNDQSASLATNHQNYLDESAAAKENAHEEYKGQANAADAQYYQNARALEELLASEGVAGGGNISAQSSLMGSRQDAQSSITSEENSFNKDLAMNVNNESRTYETELAAINSDIALLQKQNSTQALSIVQQLEAEKAQMMMDQFNSDRTFNLQEAGVTGMYNGEKTMDAIAFDADMKQAAIDLDTSKVQLDASKVDLAISKLDLENAPAIASLEIQKLQAQVRESIASAAASGTASASDQLSLLIKQEQLEGLRSGNDADTASKYSIMLSTMSNDGADEATMRDQISRWTAGGKVTIDVANDLRDSLPEIKKNSNIYGSDKWASITSTIKTNSSLAGDLTKPSAATIAAQILLTSNLDQAYEDALMTYLYSDLQAGKTVEEIANQSSMLNIRGTSSASGKRGVE